MSTVLHNIDEVRARIMWLEMAETFVQADWDEMLGALANLDRPYALADAMRRMDTARKNAQFCAQAMPATAVNVWLDA